MKQHVTEGQLAELGRADHEDLARWLNEEADARTDHPPSIGPLIALLTARAGGVSIRVRPSLKPTPRLQAEVAVSVADATSGDVRSFLERRPELCDALWEVAKRVITWRREHEAAAVARPPGEPISPEGVREQLEKPPEDAPFDVVEEASRESFPASDAPAW